MTARWPGHAPARDEPLPGGLGHGDDHGRSGDDAREDSCWWGVGSVSTVCRTETTGTRTVGEDVEHVGAVAAAEDAVLVLDDRDVEVVERAAAARGARRGAVTQLVGDERRRQAAGVSTTRTIPTSAPALWRCLASACEKVARPHCVGGRW